MNQNLLHEQRGFGIAELMIALTIGLLVTMAVSTLFLNTRQNYRQNDSTAKMQENARFTMDIITSDLRHAGFMGNVSDASSVDISSMVPQSPLKDCTNPTGSGAPGLYNFTNPIQMMSFGNQIANASSGIAFYGTCFTASDNVKPNSSILIVKRVAAQTTATSPTDLRTANTPYVYTVGNSAYLYTQPATVPPPYAGGENWEYQPRIYYIDNKDHLDRKMLSNLDLISEPMADGVEAFHIEFGIDNNTLTGSYDGSPKYLYTTGVNQDPTTTPDLNTAVSATVYVLVRTTDPDPDANYQDQKTYQLGSTGPTFGPFGGPNGTNELIDGKTNATSRSDYRYSYHHRVYSTTVMLNNIRNQVLMTQ